MPIERVVSTVETHTCGEPFRIVTSGVPRLPGATIIDRREWLEQNHDNIRTSLMLEPRGHADMYGAFMTEPITPTADFGIIFIHNEGYSDHCGHGTIALASTAVKLGWVERQIPETKVGIDAPCGYVEAFVEWDGEKVGSVRFTNVPSFLYIENASVETPTFGEVEGDIAFGGAFYFYTSIKDKLDVEVDKSNVEIIKKLGQEVKVAANKKYKMKHPFISGINKVYGTIIDGPAPETSDAVERNCCVFAESQIDRSPCGSGTCGRLAQLYLKGLLKKNVTFYNESLIGSNFEGKVIEDATCGEYKACIPEVKGTSHILGYSNWILDDADPLTGGFLVR